MSVFLKIKRITEVFMNKTEIIKTFLERYESPAENCPYENGNYDFGGRKHDDTVNLLSELVKD